MKNETETTLAQPRATITTGPTGLQLRTLDEVWRFATCLTKSGLAPKGIDTPEAITIAVQMGMEVGLPPMAAMQNIAVINGRPTLWGDAQLAVVRGTGELEAFEEWFEQGGRRLPRNPVEYRDDVVAVCRVKRRGYPAQESGYSVADAKRAGLWGKSGPWTQTPFRMLRMRARSFALRDGFGDALRGLRQAEEVADEKIIEAQVVASARVPFVEPAPVAAASEPEAQAETAPAAPAPRRGRPPKARDDSPAASPPLELSAEPENAREMLASKFSRAGIEWPEVEKVLIENLVIDEPTTLAGLDDGAVETVANMADRIIEIVRGNRAA